MNDFKMGFRHTMLQRMQHYSATPAKISPVSPVPSVKSSPENLQPPPPPTAITTTTTSTSITDFSINRILANENEKSLGNAKLSTVSVLKPMPVAANSAGILDLSKNATTPESIESLSTSSSSPLQHFNYAQFFQPDILAATKFYAHFFPHMFPTAYAAATANQATAAGMPTVLHKRFFAPYIVTGGGNQEKSQYHSPKSTSSSAASAAAAVNSYFPQSKLNSCSRSDCTGCLDYYKQYPPYKSPQILGVRNHSQPQTPLHQSTQHSKPETSMLLNSAATISLTTTTNLSITASKTQHPSIETITFNSKSGNSGPIINIPEEVSYKCRICDKVFGCSKTLQAHEKTHKSPRYECSDCGKGFSQLRNYKYHLSVHRGTKEFAAECPECGKTFNDKGYLSSHMKIHRNRKEYECPYCPKSFNQRVAFNMHVRIHTGVKPHKCAECGKRFSRKMLLKQHMRTHSGEKPYQCSVCGKSFADRSNMTLHHRLHSGIKPFNCPICPKAFTKKHHLKTHLNYHTGCKPYICPHPNCNQAFTQSSNMRTHAKKCQYRPLQQQISTTLPLSQTKIVTGNISTSSSASNLLASHFMPISGHVSSSTTAHPPPRHHSHQHHHLASPLTSTFTAGIRMLSAVAASSSSSTISSSSSSAAAAATTSFASTKTSSALTFPPPTQLPLVSTMRPF